MFMLTLLLIDKLWENNEVKISETNFYEVRSESKQSGWKILIMNAEKFDNRIVLI